MVAMVVTVIREVYYSFGNGAASFWGGGWSCWFPDNGIAAKAYGAGGGAAYDTAFSGVLKAGGTGAPGICVIEEFGIMNYALIKNNVVVNTVFCNSDNDAKKLFPDYHTSLILLCIAAGINWTYDGTNFTGASY